MVNTATLGQQAIVNLSPHLDAVVHYARVLKETSCIPGFANTNYVGSILEQRGVDPKNIGMERYEGGWTVSGPMKPREVLVRLKDHAKPAFDEGVDALAENLNRHTFAAAGISTASSQEIYWFRRAFDEDLVSEGSLKGFEQSMRTYLERMQDAQAEIGDVWDQVDTMIEFRQACESGTVNYDLMLRINAIFVAHGEPTDVLEYLQMDPVRQGPLAIARIQDVMEKLVVGESFESIYAHQDRLLKLDDSTIVRQEVLDYIWERFEDGLHLRMLDKSILRRRKNDRRVGGILAVAGVLITVAGVATLSSVTGGIGLMVAASGGLFCLLGGRQKTSEESIPGRS